MVVQQNVDLGGWCEGGEGLVKNEYTSSTVLHETVPHMRFQRYEVSWIHLNI